MEPKECMSSLTEVSAYECIICEKLMKIIASQLVIYQESWEASCA
jgi:hypothetical protein